MCYPWVFFISYTFVQAKRIGRNIPNTMKKWPEWRNLPCTQLFFQLILSCKTTGERDQLRKLFYFVLQFLVSYSKFTRTCPPTTRNCFKPKRVTSWSHQTPSFISQASQIVMDMFWWMYIYIYPIGSMYGIFTYIWLIFMVNVGKYTIHGSLVYGYMCKSMFGGSPTKTKAMALP